MDVIVTCYSVDLGGWMHWMSCFFFISILEVGYYFTHFELSQWLQEIPEKNDMTSCKQNLKLACLTCNPTLPCQGLEMIMQPELGSNPQW